MKELLQEFKDFINKGNVMALAVGIIIGGAFTSIVNSLVEDIINPLISMIGGSPEVKGLAWTFNGATVDLGAFISAIINFLIIALVVFFLVKGVNKVQEASEKLLKKEAAEEAAAAPKCPYCLSEVNEGATKCCHCGSILEAQAE
ncbi:MAG: large conductance mechanosensitive channel protein MscL [Coriobacteriales bacterium]|nr:large conductance mechanosensitive channel protein MscL [Coriobacteriales bacterium]